MRKRSTTSSCFGKLIRLKEVAFFYLIGLYLLFSGTVAAQPGGTPVPFVCNGSAYLISSPSGTVPSTLYIVDAINPSIEHATITPSTPDRYNGIGYNFEDNLLYGFATGDAPTHNPGDVVQIDAEGTVRRLGVPQPVAGQVTGMPTWTVGGTGGRVVYAAGVVGLDHKLYTMVVNGTAWYLATVDLTTMRYTTQRLSLDMGGLNDLAFSPYDGMLYGLRLDQLVRINPNNGNQLVVNPSNGPVAAAAAGGAWNDAQGRVYFYSNNANTAIGGLRLYRYNPANGNFVNLAPADDYPTFDATACFPTSLEKQVIMPTEGLEPGDVVEFEFSIYNSQVLPMTYDFEDVLASSDLSWEIASVSPASPGGGTVNISGQTLSISGITVPPVASTGGPLTFTVSVRIADAAAYETCYDNQASITTGGVTVLSDDPNTTEVNDPTLFCLNPCDLPAPISGGNIQVCATDPVQKITATATAPADVQIIWYDAPTGGNVVADPSLETVGTVTYYAAADDGVCISISRTPVTLTISPTPQLTEVADVASCGPFIFPAIAGVNLSGNEAYYTQPNGGGTRYLPGDEFSSLGATTFYVYDETGAANNCAGSLGVVTNTEYTSKDDLDELAGLNTQVIYSGTVNPAFWSGTAAQQINYNASDLIIDGQTYNTIIGRVNIADTDNCFGTEVAVSADVTLSNNGPNPGLGGVGYIAIINTATNTRLFQGALPSSPPVGATFQGHVEGVVSAADIQAGNISFMIVIETYHQGAKNWTLSDFESSYAFLPEVMQNCSDEESFELTINEPPTLVITNPDPVCLPGTVNLTAAAITQGSTAGLTYTYFEDAEGTVELTNPAAIAESGTYYIMGTDPVTGCASIAPVEVVLIGQPELLVGQPFCTGGEGSIEVLSPLGPDFEYSITGRPYQADPLFTSVEPGTYRVTARNIVTDCVSEYTEVTIDPALQVTPEVIQPDCFTPTGTIIIPRYEGASYSIDGGLNFAGINEFNGLAPGTYSVMIMTSADCESDPITVIIEEAPDLPAAPTSGGDQIVCAENPVQTLTATATVGAGETLVWYDAPVGGNVVASPTLSTIGVVTYYAEAQISGGGCPSLTRTPVTLMIQQAPHLDVVEDQEACEEYVLPEITGINLSGNEAYYTAPNGGGDRLEPGDVINTIGTTTLYIYDEIAGATNCFGALSAVGGTKVSQADVSDMLAVTHFLTSDYDAVWAGDNPVEIAYSATDPVYSDQTYKTIAGDVVFTGSPDCFGSAVRITPTVTVTNNGPGNGRGYAGRMSVINNATNLTLATTELVGTPSGTSVNLDIAAVVPISDLIAGNISILIVLETYHGAGYEKDWTVEGFSVDYQFIPEFTATCSDEQSFDVTIYDTPTAVAGDDQTLYNGGVFTLGATLPTLGTGEWSVVDGTPAVDIVNLTDPNATITLDPNTSVTLRWTVTNGTCVAFDDVVLNYTSQADIETVKVTSDAGQTEYTPGETVEYTITVTNNGPSDAVDVNIVDVDPAGAEIAGWTAEVVSGTVTLPNTSGNSSINETIDLLPNGAQVRYRVTVQTLARSTEDLVNAVTVTTPTPDPDPDCPQCETPPLPPVPEADIETVKVTSDAGLTEYTPGESVEYTITVTNNGPSDATDVAINDTAPAGTTITGWTAEVTTGTVTLPNTSGTGDINETIPVLPDGAVVTYTVTVQTPPDHDEELINAVTVTTPTPDPDPLCPQCTTPPLPPAPEADIETVKVTSDAGLTEYTPGESVEYTITVTNHGPSDATDVTIEDTAPAGTTITSWTAEVTTGTVTLPNTSGTGDINETIATLPDGAVVTYTVTVQTPPDHDEELINAVTVTTPTPDPDPLCPQCTTPPLPPAPEANIETVKVTSDAGLTEYTPGESVEYTITVTNNGPSDAQDVNINDTAPAGTTITSWTAEVTTGTVTLPATSGTGDINETIATLPNGAVVTYTVIVQTPPDHDEELINAVAVTTPTPDPNPDCPQCTTPPLPPAPEADIETVKVTSDAGLTEYTPGESVEYTITVTNHGPSDATDVTIEDTAPAGTTISSWTAVVTTGTVTLPNVSGTGDINETIATLPNGAVVTYTVTVQTPPDHDEELINAVTVTTPTPDPDPLCPQCTTPPLPPAPEADIETVKVTSDAGLTEYTPGESVEYTITVTNNGPSDATAVTISDTAPAGTTISSWTAVVTTGTVTLPNTSGTGDINETIATLPNGAVVTYTVTVQTPPDHDDDLVNAVTVTTPTPDPNPDCPQCTTPPLPPAPEADIVTVKVTSDAGLTEYTPGESVDYTITVTNNGPSDAQDVNINDTAPAGTTITSWTAEVTTGTVTLPGTSGTGDINETIATLPNGAVVTYTVTVQTPPDHDDDLVNAVTVTTPTPDPDPTCPECTTPPLPPAPEADIETVKVTSDAGLTEYTPGESVEYTITVTNHGPSDATAVTISDAAPAGTTISNWTAVVTTGTVALPATSGTGDINETIATLPDGAVVTYTVTVQTPPDHDEELINAVTVTTPTPDPDPLCPQCTTPPLPPAPEADIVTVKVTSDAGLTEYTPGESVEYTITVTNNGPSDAQNVTIEDTAPTGTTISNWTAVVTTGTVTLPNVSGTGDINETIATLPNGAVVTYTVTVQTPADHDEELINAVAVTTPTPDPNPDCPQCTTPPLPPAPEADIETVKVTSDAGLTEYTPGESVEYTITVTNNGPSDAQDVNISDTAPAGTTISSWTAEVTTGTVTLPNTSGTGDINETIATLPDGAVVTYTVTVQTPPDHDEELINAVTVTTPTPDPDPLCPQCTTPPLPPAPQANIETVKVTSDAGLTEYTPGESVEYTITVTNNGPSDAANVNINDTAPTGTTISNWTAVVTTGTVTLPATSGTGDINETIATLPNGAVVTYTVTVQTPPDHDEELINAVTVTTPTPDPDPTCPECTTPPLPPAPEADIETVKVTSDAGLTEYTPGESVEYTITVTNNGPSDAANVNINDTAPAGTTISSWTAVVTTGTVTLPNTSGTGDINETIATLPNGAVVTYTVTVQTPPDHDEELINAVTVTTPTPDPNPDCPQCTTPPLPPAPQADIETVKVTSDAGLTEYTPGESVDYTITVTNNGPSDAANVNINDTAPTGTTISNWTAVVTTGTVTLPATSGTGDINETIPVLPDGAVVTYTVTVQTPSDFTGQLVNAVTVTTPTEDPDPTCPECETPPLDPDPQADIVTVKTTSTAGQTEFTPGESVDYTITVTNNGPSDAVDVNINDTAPAGTTITSWTAVVTTGTVTLPNTSGTGDLDETIATLPDGAVVTYTVTVQTPADFTGQLVNAVTVTTPTEDPDPTCPQCEAPPLDPDPQADIETVKTTSTAGQTEFTPGESVDYTITVTNNGPSDATDVTISDTAPAGTTISSWTAEVTTGTVTLPATSGTGDINETIPVLPDGAVVTYTVTVQTPSDFTGNLVNAVTVTTPTEDPDPTCPQCTTPPLDPDAQADIVTVKTTSTAGQTEFTPGESVDYTITVTNNGPSDAVDVNINDTAPAGTTVTSWTAVVTTGTVTLPATSGSGNLDETIAVLPDGAVVTYTVTVQTPAEFTGQLVNAVTVTTPTEDPDPTCPQCETPPLDPDPQADIVTVKTVSTAGQITFVPGESVEYMIMVANNGPSDAVDVNINDTAPAGTTITGWTAVVTTGTVTLPATSGSGNLDETIAVLPDGAVVTYTVTVQTPSDFTGNLVNAVTVTTPTEDPDPTCPQCETPPLTPDPQADIATVKVTSNAALTEYTPGESVEYIIMVANNGPSDAADVNINDTAPAGTTITNWTAVVTTGTVILPNASGTGNLNETIATLPNGAVVTYTVTVQTPPDFDDDLVNAVTVTTPTPDPYPTCSRCETTPLPPAPTARESNLKVAKTVNVSEPNIGTEVVFTIEVSNAGPDDATGVVVTEQLPSGYAFVTHEAGTGTYDAAQGLWSVGNLANGATATLEIVATVNASGDYRNTASIQGNEQDPDETDNEDEVTISPVQPPVATDDAIVGNANEDFVIPIVSNDNGSTFPLDPSSIEIVSPPQNGTLTVNPDGTVMFRPNPGYTGPVTFSYRVKDSEGNWSNVATVSITVEPNPLKIPNVFTPNGDGQNDRFEIIGIEAYDRVELTVFNRWGNEVYRSRDYDNTWEGDDLTEGTYYYILTLTKGNEKQEVKRWVLLKRK